ncbi:DUF1800 domain-containing protein [Nocardioides sp.]|uniref:DUF1800 domain-containing protein n=1 Tax=Nocardioides sp. TaxID=35761 RepID=UPI002632C1A3|nr:DUF1800 domain-containing protein [Nocardioides sp.]
MAAISTDETLQPTLYTPGRSRTSPTLRRADRAVVSRWCYGVTPDLAREVKAAGSGLDWFEEQLATAYDGRDDVEDWWPALSADPSSPTVRGADAWDLAAAYSCSLLARRMTSPHQVLERMTEFWENLLHVPARPDAQVRYRADYGRTIRAGALGSYADLLTAAICHPAMQLYLSGNLSAAEHPNENLGRELLELHTVGVGNYTEADVKNSARILTGFTVDPSAATAAGYDPQRHWTGPVTVMAKRAAWPAPFRSDNADPDGRAVVSDYLGYLARHPATARRIAQRLAMVFVRDSPPPALVAELAEVYLAHDTEIVPVLRALVTSPYLAASAGAKLRDPAHDLVATHRVLGSRFARPVDWQSAANQLYHQLDGIGAAPMTWPSPNGAPIVGAPWATPVRALVSADVHYSAAGGWFPSAGVTYPDPRRFMPRKKMAFRAWVDHLSRVFLGRRSTRTLLEACCRATGLLPTDVVRRSGSWTGVDFPNLLIVLLDTPAHYYH